VPMHLLHTVSGPLTGEIMPLHGTGRASALGNAGDINCFDIDKDIDLDFLADLKAVTGRAEFANKPFGFGVRLGNRLNASGGALLLTLAIETGNVAALAAAGQTTGFVQESELNRFITVAVRRLHLEDVARTRLDHGNRNYAYSRVKNLRHPDLAAE